LTQRCYLMALALLCLLAVSAGPVHAQYLPQKPTSTKPVQIAMLYQKLTRQRPDFRGWIEQSPDYTAADMYDRAEIVKSRLEEMQETYKMLMPNEPILLEAQIELTQYSRLQKGFMVPMFTPLTFFNYVYMGENYALVPHQIMKYQWLHMDETLAAYLLKEADAQHRVKMRLHMSPLSADRKPVQIGNKAYKPLMASIIALELWSNDGLRIVWDSRKMAANDNPLLDLRR
jgi:hypothetical protein